MSAHVEVVSTDFRRTKVKVQPGTYMIDVLQEACTKLKLSSDKYLLKYKQKQVDLSAPYRTAGLSPGAKLELVVKSSSPSVVSVALQFSGQDAASIPNGRLTHKFPSDLSLWQVLRQFESGEASGGRNLNLTARGVARVDQGIQSGSGQLYYESPVLNVVGRDLSSLEDLQKTLSQIGINSGSVLMRISFKATDKTLVAAMEDISRYLKEIEPAKPEDVKEGSGPSAPAVETEHATAPAPSGDAGKDATAAPLAPGEPVEQTTLSSEQPGEASSSAAPPADDAMDVDPAPPADPLQPLAVFSAPTSATPAAALLELKETDFVPSIAHAQQHQAQLLASSHNKRLKSDKELEADKAVEAAKIAAIKAVTVRVRFPDNTQADWQFGPADTGATLYEAVRRAMAFDGEPFKLVLPGGQVDILDSDHALIKGYGLRGNTLLNLHWQDAASKEARSSPFLKASLASRAERVVVPSVAQDGAADDEDEKAAAAARAKPEKKSDNPLADAAKKLPKWLKLPGQKK